MSNTVIASFNGVPSGLACRLPAKEPGYHLYQHPTSREKLCLFGFIEEEHRTLADFRDISQCSFPEHLDQREPLEIA